MENILKQEPILLKPIRFRVLPLLWQIIKWKIWCMSLIFNRLKLPKKLLMNLQLKNLHKPRFVAGSIGPTNRTASMSPDVNDPGYRAITFDELRIAYKQQVEALIDGGVDLLLVETVFDTLNAKAALFAIEEVKEERNIDIPIMLSGTITDAQWKNLSGQTAEAFLISVSHIPLLSVGFNCALGANLLQPHLEAIANKTDFAISAHPNAGLPNAFGEYDESPEDMGEQIEEYLKKNLINIIGGCCGTTPEHIKVIAELAAKYKPREFVILRRQELIKRIIMILEVATLNIKKGQSVDFEKSFQEAQKIIFP